MNIDKDNQRTIYACAFIVLPLTVKELDGDRRGPQNSGAESYGARQNPPRSDLCGKNRKREFGAKKFKKRKKLNKNSASIDVKRKMTSSSVSTCQCLDSIGAQSLT
jgi:hypothetical protein